MLFFLFVFFCYFFNERACGMWKLLGQGSNVSCNCDLRHSYRNTRSPVWLGIEPTPSQRHHWIANLMSHSRNSSIQYYLLPRFCLLVYDFLLLLIAITYPSTLTHAGTCLCASRKDTLSGKTRLTLIRRWGLARKAQCRLFPSPTPQPGIYTPLSY